ncbi:hypothetical protein ACF0H5_019572 [Mactra antiquata]
MLKQIFSNMDSIYIHVFILYMIQILPHVHGSFDCACTYSEETPVYASPEITSKIVGLMYEFDCKPSAKITYPGWEVIQFQHEIGYLVTDSEVQVQLCSGKPYGGDVLTTKGTTPITTLHSTIVMPPDTSTPLTKPTTTFVGSSPASFIPLTKTAATVSSLTSVGSSPDSFSSDSSVPNAIDSHSTSFSSATTWPSSLITTGSISGLFSSHTTGPSILNTTGSISASFSPASRVSSVPNTIKSTSSITTAILSTSASSPFTSNALTSTSTLRPASAALSPTSLGITTIRSTSLLGTKPSTSEKPLSLLSTLLQSGKVEWSTFSVTSASSTSMPSTESTFSTTRATSIPINSPQSTVPSTDTNTNTHISSTYTQSTTTTDSTTHSTQMLDFSSPASTVGTTSVSRFSTSTPNPVMDRVDLCPYQYLAGDYNVGDHDYPHFRQYGDYCYEIRTENRNWAQARDDCVARGGDLAVVDNTEIEMRVENLVATLQNGADVWIGLQRDTNGSGYQWTDGTSLTNEMQTNKHLSIGGNTANNDCVTLNAMGKWKTMSCTGISHQWICQYSI